MDNQNPQTASSQAPMPQQSQPVVSHSSSAGPSKTFLFAIVFVLLVGVGAGAYFLGIKNAQPVAEPATTAPIVSTPIPTVDPTANWQTYTNVQYNFSIKYPSTWTANAKNNKLQLPGEILKGPEGEIDIVWGNGFGGGCPKETFNNTTTTGFEDVHINGETLHGCHVINSDGSESWNAFGKELSTITVETNATVNTPVSSNKASVMNILSTFTFATALPTGTSETNTNSSAIVLSVGQFVKDGQVQQLTVPGGMTFTKPADWTVIAPAPTLPSTFIVQVSTTVPKKVDNIIVSINKYNYDGKLDVVEWYNNTLASDHGGEITGIESFGTTNMNALVVKGDGQTTYTTYYTIYKTNVFGIVVVSNFDAHNNQEATDFLNSITFAN